MDGWKTFGHKNVKHILELELKSGNLSHGYLFYGPEGVGKKMLATEFAGKILGTDQVHSHPDFSVLDESEEITMEQIHEFMQKLTLRPFVSEKKVAILNNAHLLNTQSSNALLKTLEEPSASTILILINQNKNLLPTIVSRCQTYTFDSFTETQLKEFAGLEHMLADEKRLRLSFGRVAALLALQDKQYFENQLQDIEAFQQIQASPEAERILAIREFSDMETPQLKKLFTSWIFWQVGQLKSQAETFGVVESLMSALLALQTNKNKKLILQSLFLKI